MKHNRGLLPFDAQGSASSLTCRQEHGHRKHGNQRQSLRPLSAQLRSPWIFALVALCLILGSSSLLAQSTFGSVRGTVQDNTAAAIPGAQVTLHSTDENTDRSISSDASGNFLFENVKAGHYTVRAHIDGFSDSLISGIDLQARQDLRVTASMSVAAQTTSVDVNSGANAINTENAVVGDEKDNAQMTQLPLNNRAQTTSPLGALGLSPNVQTDSQGNIALGGATPSMVNFSVDGISTVNVRQNGALQDAYPSQEGIAAVQVTAFNNSAEFSQVGDVTFTTKSGTNNYHGSVFEYLQNQALDADPWGFNGKAPKKFNTFGFSLGGPVVIPHLFNGHNKTFFFADYEANRRSFAVLQQALVPTAAERNGDLSALNPAFTQLVPVSATAKALLGYIPMPNANVGGFNYENEQSTPARTDGADIRIDQTISAKQSAYARFSRKNITEDAANLFLPNDADSVHNRSFLFSHTYSITPKILNEFRYGFTDVLTSVNFPIEGAAALNTLGLTGVNISQHLNTDAFPTFNFSSGTGFNSIGRDKAGVTKSDTMQFSDNVTYTFGKHTVKGGVDIRRVLYADLESFAPEFASDDFGDFIFQPTFYQGPVTSQNQTPASSAFADFLIGAPTTLNFAVSSPDVQGTATQYSFFAQDEFQVNSKLTLSYGLRWQMLPGFQELGGNLANFDQRNNSIVVPDALAGYLASQNIQASNLGFQQSFNACSLNQNLTGTNNSVCTKYVTASQDGLPQSLRNTYKGNFQPRLSFAYRPFNDTRTVVRGGFGIFTMTNLGPLSFNNSGNPTSALHSYANSVNPATGQPLIQFPNTAPPSTTAQIGGGSLDQGVDPNYRDPQSNQWNITVERQINNDTTARASYVGMHTYRLSITEDLNQIPASTTAFTPTAASPYVDPRSPYPNWTEIFSTFNAGEQNYHAFELQATRRLRQGLQFDANYTLAYNRADNQGDVPGGFAGEVAYGLPIANRFDVLNDLGNAEGTRRHRMLLTGMYQLPFGQGRTYMANGRIKDLFLGGWDLTTVTLLETGPWLTPTISPSSDQSNTNLVNRGALARPDQVSNALYTGQSRQAYFNINAFAPTPAGAGRFGNAGVGILQGPGTATVSMGLAKTFLITDRIHARFESTFTNVLNHTNFAPPNTAIDQSTFGQLSAPQTAENAGNRTGQAALRVEF
jgi:Carboxypeptidase regulatory-like domain